jgi:hypothetical protein
MDRTTAVNLFATYDGQQPMVDVESVEKENTVVYASGHAKSYPPSRIAVAASTLWYHHEDTSGGTHSGDPATPLWYSGALRYRLPSVSKKREEHRAGADHAVVKGRYEITVPELVTGPKVDVISTATRGVFL